MTKNLRPVILLSALISIMLFLIGFRFGKYIERLDKSYIPPTPTAIPAPTVTQPTQVPQVTEALEGTPIPSKPGTFTHSCGVSFALPGDFEVETNTLETAMLKSGKEYISLTCRPEIDTTSEEGTSAYRPEPKIVVVKGQEIELLRTKPDAYSWGLIHPITEKRIRFEVSISISDAVLNSITFETNIF